MMSRFSSWQTTANRLFGCMFIVTIPLYFILDAVNKFWGFISFSNCVYIFLGSAFVSAVLFLALRKIATTAVASLLVIWGMVNYMFFKLIKDQFAAFSFLSFFYQYKYYLPFIFILSLVFLFIVKKISNGQAARFSSYLNFLFLALSLFELSKSIYLYASGQKVKAVTTEPISFVATNVANKPNVYLLVLDEYQGNYSMQKYFGFDNQLLIKELKADTFFVPQKPFSNYNLTPFSVLSLLDMAYITNYSDADISSGLAFNMCSKAIAQNKAVFFFRNNGYKIINNSFFPIEEAGLIKRLFLPTEERLLLDKTFGNVFMNDLMGSFPSNKLHLLIKDGPAKTDFYNLQVFAKTKDDIITEKGPFFLYAHLMMPHFPYLRDSTGKLREIHVAYKESNQGRNISSYVSYVKYCNRVLIDIVDEILKIDPQSIIVIASDHGIREAPVGDTYFNEFNNLLAIRTPGNNYAGFTDSSSLVNVFRILLNNHFQQKLPLLKEKKVNVNLSLTKKLKKQ